MLRERASRSSFVGSVFGLLAIAAVGSHSVRVEAAPGDRIGRLPFEVPSSPTRDFSGQIAMAEDASFLVVWEHLGHSPPETHDESDVMARRFTAAGVPLGPQIQLVSGAADGLVHDAPQVARAPDGTFVVVWHQHDYSTLDGEFRPPNEIHGQRYDANGAPLGARFIVSTSDMSHSYGPRRLAMAEDGRFAVVWGLSENTAAGTLVSYVRLYDANGQARTAEFQVTAESFLPAVAMSANGAFTVAWAYTSGPFADDAVRLRRFDSAGAPLGDIVDVATFNSNGAPHGPVDLAMSSSGQLVVGYMRADHVFMRRYDAAGQSLGAEARVSANEGIADSHFVLDGNAAGDFVFAWDEEATTERMLHTRLYRASGAAVTGPQGYSFREISRVPNVEAIGVSPVGTFVVVTRLLGPGGGESHLYGQLFAGVGNTQPSCARFIPTIFGTAGPEVLHGSAAHDIIYAGGGNDTVHGWGGLDVICGVDGHDVLYGGSGNDQLVGGRGDDLLDGGTGNGDYCNGESHTNADTAVSCETVRNIP